MLLKQSVEKDAEMQNEARQISNDEQKSVCTTYLNRSKVNVDKCLSTFKIWKRNINTLLQPPPESIRESKSQQPDVERELYCDSNGNISNMHVAHMTNKEIAR